MSENRDRMSFSEGLKFTPRPVVSTPEKTNKRDNVINKTTGNGKEEKLTEEEAIVKEIQQATNATNIIEILKRKESLEFLKKNRKNLKISDNKLSKAINKKVKEKYRKELKEQKDPDKVLEIANEVKQIHLIEKETEAPILGESEELDSEIVQKLQETEAVHMPKLPDLSEYNQQNLQVSMIKQAMDVGYMKEGEMVGVPIQDIKTSVVILDGRKDIFMIEDDTPLGFMTLAKERGGRRELKKSEQLQYTKDFTPEKWEKIKANATPITEEEKTEPLVGLYEELPEVEENRMYQVLEQDSQIFRDNT